MLAWASNYDAQLSNVSFAGDFEGFRDQRKHKNYLQYFGLDFQKKARRQTFHILWLLHVEMVTGTKSAWLGLWEWERASGARSVFVSLFYFFCLCAIIPLRSTY